MTTHDIQTRLYDAVPSRFWAAVFAVFALGSVVGAILTKAAM